MESTASHIESIYKKAKAYTETSIALYKLNAVDKAADVASSLVSWLVFGSIGVLFLLFVNIGISFYIGQLLGATYLGFLIVSLFYLIVGICVYIFNKDLITKPITNFVISKLTSANKEEVLMSKNNNVNTNEK
ncbi:hypothetical protein [Kordia zhangzhouensis]|uniref:hypothetical protein n=1 Tax=Kordia zhangzhouensis TaxID=1620405 RepID=UPI000629C6C8|nr:hypothetical protein [Kordia zhangzhouensis]